MRYHGGVSAFHFAKPVSEKFYILRTKEEQMQYLLHLWVAETLLHLFGDR